METKRVYDTFEEATVLGIKLLAILIDPEKFDLGGAATFLKGLPEDTSHIFVGGSTVDPGDTQQLIETLKIYTSLPIIIFPGDYTQISDSADGLLFLSLLSGRNPEYLIGQQVKAAALLKDAPLEVIPTAYILIDGGQDSAVARVTQTQPMSTADINNIVHTAKAGALMGAKLVYLEAGSGALHPIPSTVISEVKKVLEIPLIVGGGIKTNQQKQQAYASGADLVVMGTVFEMNQ